MQNRSHISHRALAIALSGALFAASCASTAENPNAGRNSGALLGALVGGLACAAASGTTSECIAAAVVGGLAGGLIGSRLDKQAQEARAAALMATLNRNDAWTDSALQQSSGASAAPANSWRSPDGDATGTITPLRAVTQNGKECRDVRETVRFVNGEPVTETSRFCKNAQNTWQYQGAANG